MAYLCTNSNAERKELSDNRQQKASTAMCSSAPGKQPWGGRQDIAVRKQKQVFLKNQAY